MASRALVALLLLVAACHHSSTAPAPDLVGTITSRAAVKNGDSVPQMFVEGDPPSCDNSYFVFLWKLQRVWYASGASADTSALAVGAQVEVWTDGNELTSCPAQVAAINVQIDRAAPGH